MNADDQHRVESVTPPRWAESLLRLGLAADDAETVSGDLIEEYREVVYPSRGRWRSLIWYATQVIGFVWRGPLVCGLGFAALLSGRAVLDAYAPPLDWQPRSAVTSWIAIALIVLAGAWSARRTRRAASGAVVAFVTLAIAWPIAGAFQVALYASVISHDPAKLRVFQMIEDYERSTAVGWVEAWLLRLVFVAIVVGLGALGGLVGKSLGSTRTRPVV